MITKENKDKAIASVARNKKDVGSPEVQVAILTARIKEVTEHVKNNKHDFMAKRGLMQMVGKRKQLLKYLEKTDFELYKKSIGTFDKGFEDFLEIEHLQRKCLLKALGVYSCVWAAVNARGAVVEAEATRNNFALVVVGKNTRNVDSVFFTDALFEFGPDFCQRVISPMTHSHIVNDQCAKTWHAVFLEGQMHFKYPL